MRIDFYIKFYKPLNDKVYTLLPSVVEIYMKKKQKLLLQAEQHPISQHCLHR